MLKEPPFTQPIVDLSTGRITLPWIDYFKFWETINSKVDLLSSYTPGNIVRVGDDGGITDGGSGFAISKFSAYDETGDITIGLATWTNLDWDKETWKDNDFSHDDETPGAEITCNFDGKVEITVYGTLYVSSYSNVTVVQCKGQYFDGDSWYDIGGLLAELTFSAASQRLNFTIVQPVTVSNGWNIKIVANATSGASTINTLAGACGVKIERKQ